MELLHTVLWRYYEKAGSLTKDQIGRILLAIDELETKIFKSTSVIKMRLGVVGAFSFCKLFQECRSLPLSIAILFWFC
jgi:hypothetical protein